MTELSPRQQRSIQAWRFADQLGIDREELREAANAVWSNMNPQSTHYDQALSIAGVALLAAQRERVPRLHAEFRALMEELSPAKREAERGDSTSVRARLANIQLHATAMLQIADPPDMT